MAQNVHLFIDIGATFKKSMIWQDKDGNPINLTGFVGAMQIRDDYGGALICGLTTENGCIILGGIIGSIDLLIPKDITKNFLPNKNIYDLVLKSPGNEVKRLIEGPAICRDKVTQPGL